jgi:hypothetical protein
MELQTAVMAQEQEGVMAVLEETTVLLVVVVVVSALMPVLAELKLPLGDKEVTVGLEVGVEVEEVVGEAAMHAFLRGAVAVVDMLAVAVEA